MVDGELRWLSQGYTSASATIFLYGCESWVLSLHMESKINAFATTSCYRIMLGIKRQDCISNIAIYSMTNTEPLGYEAPARLISWTHPSSSRGRACMKICFLCTTSWQKEARSSMHLLHHIHPMLGYHEVDISADEMATLAKDRCAWRNLVIACSTAEG